MFRYLSVNETVVNVLLSKTGLNLFYADIVFCLAGFADLRELLFLRKSLT